MLSLVLNLMFLSLSLAMRLDTSAFKSSSTAGSSSSSSSSSTTTTISSTTSAISSNAYNMKSTAPPDLSSLFKLDVTTIHGPQLVGILAGCLVFTVTICVVFYLLYASGTLSRAASELKHNVNAYDKKNNVPPQISECPMLYDHLLEASLQLSNNDININELKSKNAIIKKLKHNDDDEINMILSISNGTAIYGESAYDPSRIWGWIDQDKNVTDIYIEEEKQNDNSIINVIKEHDIPYPSSSEKSFRSFYNDKNNHFVIYDPVIKKPVGMFSLTDNIPKYLTIRISNLWITPAYQGKKKGHESMLLILQELFAQGYRRVSFEVNVKNVIMRKFLERCGFIYEAMLRKHKIVLGRNRDTCVYAVLNSEFVDCEMKLKKYLGLNVVPKPKKVADLTIQILPTLDDRDNELFKLFDTDKTNKPKGSNDKSKKKKSKK